MNYFRIIHNMAWLALIFLVSGCANIVPPEGGKKDETAPVLLSITPADSSLNIKPTKIELHFNEYIDVKELEKNLSLSPLLPISPTVISYGKRVEIKIQDTQLLANTTYRIGLGDALVDNHEGNPYKNFVYLFSTGSYFDSLQLQGNVIDAATGKPDSATLITLYDAAENDTSVLRKKPLYAIKTDGSGSFTFQSLPKKAFRIYAIHDANNNYLYDYGDEKIGFVDQAVMPDLRGDSLHTFYMFKEIPDTAKSVVLKPADSTGKTDRSGKVATGRGSSNKSAKNKIGYQVNVDTSNQTQRTFELTKQLTIDLFTELEHLDTAKVYLSYENKGIEVEAIQKLHVDSSKIKISTQWQPDKVYTLRLVKGWAKDTAGAELPPGKYFFRTKREEDYGILKIHVGQQYLGEGFVLFVYKDADSIYQKPITDSIITIGLLQPGDYNIRIIIDANRNGKWDPGNLLKKIQPEKVIPHGTVTTLKAGWENEIDFVPQDNSKRPKPRTNDHRQEAHGSGEVKPKE